MRHTDSFLLAVSLAVATATVLPLAVHSDAISPSIKDTGKKYSKEAPETSYYGSGVGGRYMEASSLRFDVDRLMQDAEWDKAIVKAKKACQLDPADPETHLLLARALTHKLQSKSGPIDKKLLAECMTEWKLIWMHDADSLDQMEGKGNFLKLQRIAKGLERQHKLEMKERQRAKEALVQLRQEQANKSEGDKTADEEESTQVKTSANATSGKGKTTTSAVKNDVSVTPATDGAAKKKLASKKDGSADDEDSAKESSSSEYDRLQVAQKRKRFLLF